MKGSKEDEELASFVERAMSGDRQAFDVLVSRHLQVVHRRALRIMRDVAAAEDVSQDAFMQAWDKLRQLDDPRCFLSWLLRITTNIAFNRRRCRARTQFGALPDVIVDASQAMKVPHTERLETVLAAADLLSPEYRTTIQILHRGGDFNEIAQHLRISIDLARQWKHRALSAIRVFLVMRAHEAFWQAPDNLSLVNLCAGFKDQPLFAAMRANAGSLLAEGEVFVNSHPRIDPVALSAYQRWVRTARDIITPDEHFQHGCNTWDAGTYILMETCADGSLDRHLSAGLKLYRNGSTMLASCPGGRKDMVAIHVQQAALWCPVKSKIAFELLVQGIETCQKLGYRQGAKRLQQALDIRNLPQFALDTLGWARQYKCSNPYRPSLYDGMLRQVRPLLK